MHCLWKMCRGLHLEAREVMGTNCTTGQIMEKIERDSVFYRRSGGGVTVSGGEATWQPDLLHDIALRCNRLGINLTLESCGFFDWKTLERTLKMMDLIFIDIKHMDPEVHMKHTGKSNSAILQNAVNIGNASIPMVIRIPVIPGINDSKTNIAETALFVKENLQTCRGIELLPYHVLGKNKYKSLDREYDLDGIKPPPEGEMEDLKETVRQQGITVLKF